MGLTVNLGPADSDPIEPQPGLGMLLEEPGDEAPAPAPAAPEPERIELFSINGRAYSIPKRPGPNVAVRYLRDVRRNGREYAVAGLMEAMLGREGLDALADYEDLTDAELDSVMTAVERHVLGPLERGKAGKR
jgi:hypothetical protein